MISNPCGCRQELAPEVFVPPVRNPDPNDPKDPTRPQPPVDPPPPKDPDPKDPIIDNNCCVPMNPGIQSASLGKKMSAHITWGCWDYTGQKKCKQDGQPQFYILFSEPTPPEGFILWFAQVWHTEGHTATDRWYYSGRSIIDTAMDAKWEPMSYKAGTINYATEPFECKIPGNVTEFIQMQDKWHIRGGPVMQGSIQFDPFFCHSCNNPIYELWIKVASPSGYSVDFTLETADKVVPIVHSVKGNATTNGTPTSGNKLLVYFEPCIDISAYNVKWRRVGTTGAYTQAGIFSGSPVTIYDTAGSDTDRYEAIVQAIGNQGACDEAKVSQDQSDGETEGQDTPAIQQLIVHTTGYPSAESTEVVLTLDKPAIDQLEVAVYYVDWGVGMGGGQETQTVSIPKGSSEGKISHYHGSRHAVPMDPCIMKVKQGTIDSGSRKC